MTIRTLAAVLMLTGAYAAHADVLPTTSTGSTATVTQAKVIAARTRGLVVADVSSTASTDSTTSTASTASTASVDAQVTADATLAQSDAVSAPVSTDLASTSVSTALVSAPVSADLAALAPVTVAATTPVTAAVVAAAADVPEPSSLALIAAGLLGTVGLRRRRK